MKLTEARMSRRSLVSGSMASLLGATVLGNSQASFGAAVVDDISSGDPNINPAFPYASDGLIYNFVSGTVLATTNSAMTVLIAERTPPMTVAITVPADAQIYGPISLSGQLADIKVGDRIDMGTSFLSHGVRYARWINVNLLTGWSELLDSEPRALETAPVGKYSAGGRAPVFSLTLDRDTKIIAEDGSMLEGDPSGLKVGDLLYWTAVASTPAYLSSSALAIVVHSLTRME